MDKPHHEDQFLLTHPDIFFNAMSVERASH